jgi:hypothetical protein
MKVTKRHEYFDKKSIWWQIENSDYFLDENKKNLYLFIPYTADEEGGEDIELYEDEGSGSTWIIYQLEAGILKEFVTKLKKEV